MEREAVMKGCDVPCKGTVGECSHGLIVPLSSLVTEGAFFFVKAGT